MRVRIMIISIFIYMFFISCATTVDVDNQGSSYNKEGTGYVSSEEAEECSKYRSWQFDYWKDKNYRRSIYCNMYMMDLNCDLSENPVHYYNLARSFIELDTGKADSAFWALNIGMNVAGESEALLELGAYISKKINNSDDQIFYLENVRELYPNNQRVLEQLSVIYGQQAMYEEQIEILDLWLEFQICDTGSSAEENKNEEIVCINPKKYKKAIGEKKRAYQYQGWPTSEVDLERWESDKSNLQYGLYYLRSLKEQEEWYDIISYADEMLFYDNENIYILEMKAEAQETEFEYHDAVATYEDLYDIASNYKYAIDISKILVEESNFEDAYRWAKEAVEASSKNANQSEKGESIYQRGEVLFYLGRSCQDQNINFWDKIVYQIALKDYKEAYKLKNYNAKLRVTELEKDNYYIATATDWALNASGANEVCPSCKNDMVDVSLKECYSFIDVRIKK